MTGSAASIYEYNKFHEKQKVETSCKSTSQEEEEAIFDSALESPTASAFQCAIRSSAVLSGNPSFPHV